MTVLPVFLTLAGHDVTCGVYGSIVHTNRDFISTTVDILTVFSSTAITFLSVLVFFMDHAVYKASNLFLYNNSVKIVDSTTF